MQYSITRLRKILIDELKDYPGKPILLPFDDVLLEKILFDYSCYRGKEFETSISEILTKINYSNISFKNFNALKFDFSSYVGIKINPQELWQYDLNYAICKGVEFTGSFDNVKIRGTNFTGSTGVKIDPQTIDSKSLLKTICCDVEFIGSFDGVMLESANFKGSRGARINPQEVAKRNLKNTICANVKFIGPYGSKPNFEGLEIDGANFTGSNYEEIIKFENEFREKIKLMKYSLNPIE